MEGTQGEIEGVFHGPTWMEEAEKAMTTYYKIADLDQIIKLLLFINFTHYFGERCNVPALGLPLQLCIFFNNY